MSLPTNVLRQVVVAVIAFLACGSTAWGEAAAPAPWTQDARARLDALLVETAVAQSVPEASYAIVHGGEVVHRASVSAGSLRPDGALPFRYQVGSVSKPVAATAALTLVADGAIDLDEPVSGFVDDWAPAPTLHDAEAITLRRLLSHTAGLSLGGYIGFAPDEAVPTALESLEGASNPPGPVRLLQAPGDGFRYAGGGYTLMQHLLEKLDGRRFPELVTARVLRPLGMRHSGYGDASDGARTLAPHDARGRPLPTYRFAALAAAGLWSTTDDLARFAQLLLDVDGTPLLPPALRVEQRAPVDTRAGPSFTGLGVFLRDDGRVVGHSGSNVGWKARLETVPEYGAAIVVLTNGEAGSVVVQQLLCAWARTLDDTLLAEDCAGWRAAQARDGRWRAATLAIALLLLAVLCTRLLRARGLLRPTSARLAGAAALVCAGCAALAAVALFTGVGARLVAGVAVPADTIGFAAQPLRGTLYLALAALVLLSANLGLRAQRAGGTSLSDQS